MNNLLSRLITRASYGATQLPRMVWYIGHGLAMRRLSERMRQRSDETTRPRPFTDLAVPGRSRLYADMAALMRRDLANIEAGIYPLPRDHNGPLLALLERSWLFFESGATGAPVAPVGGACRARGAGSTRGGATGDTGATGATGAMHEFLLTMRRGNAR